MPYESLSGPTGSAGVFVENWEPVDGVYTSLAPYGGILPLPGYGQPESTTTGTTAAQVGYGGSPNETWARLSWGPVASNPINQVSGRVFPTIIRPDARTRLEFNVNLTEPNATVTRFCAHYLDSRTEFDATRTAYVQDAFGVVTNLSASTQPGQCDGSQTATYRSVILTGVPVITSDSTFFVPIRDRGRTDFSYQDARTITVYMDTPPRNYVNSNTYRIAGITRRLTGQVDLPNTVKPGTTANGTVGYDSGLEATLPEDFPLTIVTTASIRIDNCFGNITFNPPAGTTITQTGSPTFSRGVPRCRGGDTGSWTYTATTTQYLTSETTPRVTTIPFTVDVPAAARPNRTATIYSAESGSITVPYEEYSAFYRSTGSDSTVVEGNPNLIQEVYQDAPSVEVGNRAGWTMIATNDTGLSGSGTFVYEFNRSQPRPVQMSAFQLTASGDATLAMVSTSTNQSTWTPWDPAATTVPRYIRIQVPSLNDGWEGSLNLSFSTAGTRPGSKPRVRAIGGTASFFTTVVGTTWKEVRVYVNAPAIDLLKTVVGGKVIDANNNGVEDRGDRIDYELNVANSGITDLAGIDLTDSITSVTCPQTTLAVGQEMTCQAGYTLTQADIENGSVVNNATASGRSVVNGQLVNSSSSATQSITQVPLISFTMTGDTSLLLSSGDPVKFDFKIVNTGNLNVSNLRLTDALLGWTNVVCESGFLAPEATAECSATYNSTAADYANGGFTNEATATASTVAGPLTRSDSWLVRAPSEHGDPEVPIRIGGGL